MVARLHRFSMMIHAASTQRLQSTLLALVIALGASIVLGVSDLHGSTGTNVFGSLSGEPSIVAHPQNQTVRVGANVSMTVSAVGNDPLAFFWRRNGSVLTDGGNVSGATNANLTLSNVTFSDSGSYSVIVSNASGSTTSIGATLTMNSAPSATLTLRANVIGSTPELLAYNSGHFYPESNTKDWWRYSGVSGARVFLTADLIETTDDIPGRGDGVIDQNSFLTRKAALRLNPNSPAFINWPVFVNGYNTIAKHGANRFRPIYVFSELRKLGVQIDVNIGASQNTFVISGTNDWAGKWELWQHYYAEAFYLGRQFEVERYQMYNEPDHPNAGGLTTSDYLQRLQLCSDAVQTAISDVNSLYDKALVPKILAPVVTTPLYGDWGKNVVTNRHLNFLGQIDPSFSLLHQYDYHQYNATPAQFGTLLGNLRSSISNAMAPEAAFPVSISEFNVHTAGVFDTMPETLDHPTKYPRLGAISVNLVKNGMNELYNFKFSQTDGDAGDAYPVRKNGMHYVDNGTAPYNIGGITKAGEVWRLFNKGLAPGRQRLEIAKSSGANGLDVEAAYDPVARRYFVYSANHTTNAVPLSLDLSPLSLQPNGRILVEEVSETTHGSGRFWTTVAAAHSTLGTQSGNSVWLITTCRALEMPEVILVAAEDAEVRDGVNKGANYGGNSTLMARNDPDSVSNRSVALLKFQLPTNSLSDLQYAVLSLQAAVSTTGTTAQAHVYGITDQNWSQSTVTWSNAPNLQNNIPPGTTIAHQFVKGQGVDVSVVGQVVASSTMPTEKLLDVTSYLRAQTNTTVSFLISQDPRWNLALPSLAPGDTQSDGVTILSRESGRGPHLRLVFKQNGGANNAPAAANDDYSVTAGTTLAIEPPGVLLNDFDPEGDPVAAVFVSLPAHGDLTLNSNGGFEYAAAADFSGIDTFTYKANDGKDDSALASVFITVHPQGGTPYSTNLPAAKEAFIRGGTSASVDQDEAATGYLMVKYGDPPFNVARKTYFQFDLTGLGANLDNEAVFTVTTHTTNAAQRGQLWGLKQAYTNFSPTITWDNAQANDRASNDLLTSGPLFASPIGASVFFTLSTSVPHSFTIPRLGDYVFSNRITMVLAGVDDSANSAGGLRLARTNARLQITAGLALPQITTHPVSRTNGSGTTATFSASAQGTWPLTYQWTKNGVALSNGGNLSGAASPTLTLHDVSSSDGAEYAVVVRNGAGSATSSGAVLTVYIPPRFESVSVLPNGACRLVLTGAPDRSYSIEASTNLLSWISLTNVSSPSGTFEFTDSEGSGLECRFYRAR